MTKSMLPTASELKELVVLAANSSAVGLKASVNNKTEGFTPEELEQKEAAERAAATFQHTAFSHILHHLLIVRFGFTANVRDVSDTEDWKAPPG